MKVLSDAPYKEGFTLETLEFASKRPNKKMPGSLYFKSGRIRLHHPNGPKISKHEGIRRYALSGEDFRSVKASKAYRQRNWDAVEGRLKNDGKCHSIKLDKGKRLIEFFKGRDEKN